MTGDRLEQSQMASCEGTRASKSLCRDTLPAKKLISRVVGQMRPGLVVIASEPLSGALWNSQAELELRKPPEVVAAARAMPLRRKGAENAPNRRPGWATQLVVEVLRNSEKAMSAKEISDEIRADTGEAVGQSSVNYSLRYSRPARDGKIQCVGKARYRFMNSESPPAPDGHGDVLAAS